MLHIYIHFMKISFWGDTYGKEFMDAISFHVCTYKSYKGAVQELTLDKHSSTYVSPKLHGDTYSILEMDLLLTLESLRN